MKNNYPILFIFTVLFFSFLHNINAQPNFNTINDDKFFFEINIPSNWNTKKTESDSSLWRLTSTSPTKNLSLEIYAGKIEKGFIDLEKLPDFAKKTFNFLGNEKDRNKIGANKYEVNYDNKNKYEEYSKVVYLTKENFYYVLTFYSKQSDLSESNDIIKTFHIKAPFSWYAIIYILGSISVLIHCLFINFIVVKFIYNAYIENGKELLIEFLFKWNFLWSIPLLLLLFWIVGYWIDYKFIGSMIHSSAKYGKDGFFYELINWGPKIFEIVGEFISEFIAGIVGFSFWPGGKTGVIGSTIVSVIVNALEFYYLFRKKNV